MTLDLFGNRESLSVEGWRGTADYGTALGEHNARWRYSLTREWPDGEGAVVFCMLNPSTATAAKNDPTIRRCIGYARAWGFRRLVVVNAFALRSTDPRALKKSANPEGDPRNLDEIRRQARAARLVVCAWGQHAGLRDRDAVVLRALREEGVTPHALKLTDEGKPWHPLYLPADLKPFPLETSS